MPFRVDNISTSFEDHMSVPLLVMADVVPEQVNPGNVDLSA